MGILMNWLYDWANSPSPTNGKGTIIIEHRGKYWDGLAFVANKNRAKCFPSHRAAWNYVDETFSENRAEEIGLERK